MSGSYTGDCSATTYFQIDAKSTDEVCNIAYTGGNMSGITRTNPTLSGGTITGTWTIPAIAGSCYGKTVYAWAAGLWNGAPGAGSLLSNKIDAVVTDNTPVAGSFAFATTTTTTTSSSTTTTRATTTTTSSSTTTTRATTTTTSSTTTTTTPPSYFTIAVLPDVQLYTASYPTIFDQQAQWIVNNAQAQNIVFVAQLGDLTNDWGVTSEWTNAVHSMGIIRNAGIPYSVVPGNHDVHFPAENTTYFNQYFPYTNFTGYSWYGGHYPSNSDTSNYELFSAMGQNFIVLNIVSAPGLYASASTWANNTLTQYSNRKAIVITHGYIDWTGAYTDASSVSGIELWNQIVRYHSNVIAVLCGHMHNGCSNSQYHGTTTGLNGNTIYNLLTDYQDCPNGGDGWLRLYKFYPSMNKISAVTYSPYLNQYDTSAAGQFDLYLDLGTTTTTTTTTTSTTTTTTSSTTSTTITIVNCPAGTTYGACSCNAIGIKACTASDNPNHAISCDFYTSSICCYTYTQDCGLTGQTCSSGTCTGGTTTTSITTTTTRPSTTTTTSSITTTSTRPMTTTPTLLILKVAASNSPNPGIADYVCDGVADENEINTAISHLPAGSGEVLLLPGTFNLKGPVKMLDNTQLVGSGIDVTILKTPGTDVNAIVNSKIGSGTTQYNILLQGFTVDGGWTGTTGSNNCIEVQNINGFTMYQVKVINPPAFCCSIRFSTNILVDSCVARASGAFHDGFKLAGCSYGVVQNNDFAAGDDATSATGEQLEGHHITIQNNRLTSDFAHGVYIGPESGADARNVYDITVIGNTIYNTSDAGISVYGANANVLLTNITIQNNTIINPGMRTTNPNGPAYGIHVCGYSTKHSTYITVHGNNIEYNSIPTSNPDVAGILFEFVDHSKILSNTISMNQTLVSEARGIWIGETGEPSTDITIQGNEVNNNGHGDYALLILRSNNILVNQANTFKNAGRAGVRIAGDSTNPCRYITVDGNNCIDDQTTHTQQYGIIEESTSDYNTITNNLVSGDRAAGVSYVGTHDTVSGNHA